VHAASPLGERRGGEGEKQASKRMSKMREKVKGEGRNKQARTFHHFLLDDKEEEGGKCVHKQSIRRNELSVAVVVKNRP
jgi:hypothetical protein